MQTTEDDYFGSIADRYLCRPGYPDDLFDYLASLCAKHERAWDCGTGNGQAARSLSKRFGQVVATDRTPEQIAVAKRRPDPKIEFREGYAESSGLEPASIDLVTVAQAVHWFDFGSFATEVRRVTRVGGVLAVWCYRTPTVAPDIDRLVAELYDAPCLAPFWSAQRRYIDENYAGISLPFPEVRVPEFTSSELWAWPRFADYLRTWQAVARGAGESVASEFVSRQLAALAGAWGAAEEQRSVSWRLWVRACVKPAEPNAGAIRRAF